MISCPPVTAPVLKRKANPNCLPTPFAPLSTAPIIGAFEDLVMLKVFLFFLKEELQQLRPDLCQ